MADPQHRPLPNRRTLATTGLVAAAVAVAALAAAMLAGAASGELTYKSCITGETESGPSGTDACTEIGDAAADGEDSGLDELEALALSADGKSLYVGSVEDDAVARFKRDTGNGALTYKGCITGETESGPSGSGACEEIADATSGGASSGLDDIGGLALSPDGKSLYAVAEEDDAVARFKRDTGNGALTYKGCITGETETGPGGSGACEEIADATGNGALTYKGCITGSATAGPGGTGACDEIASVTAIGTDSGLEALGGLALSADGKSLYAASEGDDAVSRFKREP